MRSAVYIPHIPTSPGAGRFIERSHPDFSDPELRPPPANKVREAVRRRCASCPDPRACAGCVFADYELSPDPEGRAAAREERVRLERRRVATAGGRW